jgi:carbonic anhydrase
MGAETRMVFWGKAKPVERLFDGYRKFRRTTFARERSQYERLAKEGQKPKILIIACSDSRVSPSVIFNTPPGSIFVARNIANIVPPHDPDGKPRSIGAAVEYAIKVLNVTDIVVKGHARCGGVQALVNQGDGLPQTDYLKAWVEVAAPARALFPEDFEKLSAEDKRRASEQAVIQHSIINLSGFPWVRERLDAGSLSIHGVHFDFSNGRLTRLDHESGDWVEVR